MAAIPLGWVGGPLQGSRVVVLLLSACMQHIARSRIQGTLALPGIDSAGSLVTFRMIQTPNPRARFGKDHCRSISTRLTAGNSVILGIDHNADVRTGDLPLKLKDLGLIDSILTLHSAASSLGTFNRNTTRTPIDALWASQNAEVL